MRKICVFLKWIIQAIIIVYIIIIVLLHLPVVQNVIGIGISKAISEKLGTHVKIDQIELGFLNRIVINNMIIYDQRNYKMLSAERLAFKVDVIPLIEKGCLSVSSVQLFGMKGIFYKPQKAPANYQFVLDSLSSKNNSERSNFNLSIRNLIMRNCFLKYDRLGEPLRNYGFDLNHIRIENLSANLIINNIAHDTISAEVRSLSLKERSGFKLDRLGLKLFADNKHAELSKVYIVTPYSKLLGANLDVYYCFEKGKLKKSSLRGKVRFNDAIISTSDIRLFVPTLRYVNRRFSLSINSTYNVNRIKLYKFSLSSCDRSLFVKAKGELRLSHSVPDIYLNKVSFGIDSSTLKSIDNIFKLKIPKKIIDLGNIYYQGSFTRTKQLLSIKGHLRNKVGEANINLKIKDRNFTLSIYSPLIRMYKIIGDARYGNLSIGMNLLGTTDLKNVGLNVTVPSFVYNNHSYKNISVKGLYANDSFGGKVRVNDPNGTLSFDGVVSDIYKFISKKKKLNIKAKVIVKKVDLSAFHFTKILGSHIISFTSELKGSFSNLSDISGFFNFSNVTISSKDKVLSIKKIRINTENDKLIKNIDIESDYGEAHVSGSYNLSTLFQSFKNIIHAYLPSLVSERYIPMGKYNKIAFDVQLKNYDAIKEYIKLPLKLESPIAFNGKFNEKTKDIDFFFESKKVSFADTEMKNVDIRVGSKEGNLITTIKGEYNNVKKPHFYINTFARIGQDKISSIINCTTEGKIPFKSVINSDILFYNHGGSLATRVHFNPSNINIDTISLTLQPSDMIYYRKNLIINHFEISNKTQHIIVNGKTSGDPEDSLSVYLKDIEVPYILDLVNFHDVNFGGLASGTASVKSIFSHPIINTKLFVKDFTFQDGPMGELTAESTYDSKNEIAYINAKAVANNSSYTDIKGYVDLKNEYINLPIYAHNTKLYFMKSYCDSFMDNIEGSINGWCKVVGPLSHINLEGDLVANGRMSITPIGTTYTFENSHIKMLPNEIIFDKDTIRDVNNNIGVITGGLSHDYLSNFSYNVNIATKNLLCYNFPQQINKESFWGVVYGTGTCHVKGLSGETTLDVNLSPEPNSHIVYDASRASSLGENYFIRWNEVKNDSLMSKEKQLEVTNKGDTIGSGNSDVVFHNFNNLSDLNINFLFNTNPNLTMEVITDESTRDNLLLNGYGGIRATYYNKGSFQMYGNFFVDHGAYNITIENAIKKTFAFLPTSTIVFGGDPFNATLNLQGVYSLSSVSLSDLQIGQPLFSTNTKVNCLLNIKGTAGSPNVTFGINFPNLSDDAQQIVHSLLNSEEDLNQQVLYLLAIGRFYPQTSNNSLQNNAAQHRTSLAVQSLLSGTLSQQINTILSNVINSNNWNFGTNIATGNEGLNNAEYEGIFSGRLFNDRLLLNGELGYRDNVATNSSSFIGDFDLRYLLQKNGNVAFHFYNKNNDRYFARNSLTTQGIGIILKKDFTNLRDLFGLHNKNKKK